MLRWWEKALQRYTTAMAAAGIGGICTAQAHSNLDAARHRALWHCHHSMPRWRHCLRYAPPSYYPWYPPFPPTFPPVRPPLGLPFSPLPAIAAETCEELFTPNSPHIWLGLGGADIISNGSGSHHQLRKLHQRLELMRSATAKGGGVYMYANQQVRWVPPSLLDCTFHGTFTAYTLHGSNAFLLSSSFALTTPSLLRCRGG